MNSLLEVALSNAVAVTGLAVVVYLVTRFLRNPALCHGLWVLVLVKLITPPVVSIPFPAGWTMVRQPAVAESAGRSEAGESVPSVEAIPIGDYEPLPLASETDFSSLSNAPSLVADTPEASVPETAVDGAALDSAWRVRVDGLCNMLLSVWLCGIVLVALTTGVRIYWFQRMLRLTRSVPLDLQNEVRALAVQIGITRCPEIYVLPAAVGPTLWAGWGRPKILFPEKLLANLGRDARRALLLHELSHLRRRDHWVRMLEVVVTALYWWHPVVWWVRREIRPFEEACCDGFVVSEMPDSRRTYATALVESLRFLGQPRPVLPPATSGIGGFISMKKRVTTIMVGNHQKGLSGVGRLVLAVAAALCLPLLPALGMGDKTPPDTETTDQESMLQSATSPKSPVSRQTTERSSPAARPGGLQGHRVLFVSPGNDAFERALKTEVAAEIVSVEFAEPAHLEAELYRTKSTQGYYRLIVYDRCAPAEMPKAHTLFIGRVPLVHGWSTGKKTRLTRIEVVSGHPITESLDMRNILVAGACPINAPKGSKLLLTSDIGTLLAIVRRDGFHDAALAFELVTTDERDGSTVNNTDWFIRRSFPAFVTNVLHFAVNGDAELADATRNAAIRSYFDAMTRPTPREGATKEERAPLANRALSEIVDAFLQHDRELKRLEAGYTVLQKDVFSQQVRVLEKGMFGIDEDRLAARSIIHNAVYDGSLTRYTLQGVYAETKGTGSLFAHHWSTPALAFHRMQDTQLTPIARVLRDAIGPRRFGEAQLLGDHPLVNGDPCYVVEGTYDRVKLNTLDRDDKIIWKYRLFLSPRHGMRMAKMETFNVAQNIPLGSVVVERFEQHRGVWIPMRAVFKSYSYHTDGASLGATHVYDNVIELAKSTLLVNEPPRDPQLFNVRVEE